MATRVAGQGLPGQNSYLATAAAAPLVISMEEHRLVARAADVCLKERRRVVLMFRETPLHAGHIKSMLAVTEMGASVAMPVPAFYARPRSVDDIVTHSVARALDLFGLDTKTFPRWTGPTGVAARSAAAKRK